MMRARVAYAGAIHEAHPAGNGVQLADGRVLREEEVVWLAPFESVSVTLTCSPAAGTNPRPSPSSFQSVIMNVCDWPTRLVASGAIVIFASTQRFDATSVLPCWPSVFRVSGTVPTVTVV